VRQYEPARRELEQRVLEESRAAPAGTPDAPPAATAWTAAILAGGIPLAALLLYVVLGSHEAFAPPAAITARSGAEHDTSPQQVDQMAQSLAARLAQEPGNAEWWVMLARTYYVRNRHAEAAQAFERAVALVPGNADLLADYADALGATQGGLTGKPEQLIKQALEADPAQWKALALAGTLAFDRKNYAQAVAHWEKLKATVPPEAQSPVHRRQHRRGAAVGASPGAAPPAVALAPQPQSPRCRRQRQRRRHRLQCTTGSGVAGTVSSPDARSQRGTDRHGVHLARPAQGPKCRSRS
jgi:cytochrome c-type biogenesis protein CcmH